ncbi:MAG: class I tRNA ligase family protein, partial [Candidatus Odinarchaeota archaeon]
KLDKWIISRLHSTIKKITELSDEYQLPWITGELRDFVVNDISRWYIMLNREKLDIYSEDPDKLQIMAVLHQVLYNYLLLLAPVNPMMAEEIYLTMFKPNLKSMGLKETKSLHLQEWPQFNEKRIDLELEKQMHFTRDLIENIRALKDENKIRLRWPNKKLIIEPKEDMPKIEFPDIIKQIGNVKELEVSKSVKEAKNLLKMETKYCNIYLDTSMDDDLLAERVVNDLIRNIQFSRKKNKYNVGEDISLIIGTDTNYLNDFIQKSKEFISEKVTASKVNVIEKKIEEEKDKVYGQLYICPNKQCSASLKQNIISKFKKQSEVKCPYCDTKLKESEIKTIKFNFKRQS